MDPNDLGDFFDLCAVSENLRKLDINELVKQSRLGFKRTLISSLLDADGIKIEFQTSKTRFGGERFWFTCPLCSSRKGVLYEVNSFVGCRQCLGVKYKKQRFKGMIEIGG